MRGSIYEATILVEFTTGCTGKSKENAASAAAQVLADELNRARIINSHGNGDGLFKARIIDFSAIDLREQPPPKVGRGVSDE